MSENILQRNLYTQPIRSKETMTLFYLYSYWTVVMYSVPWLAGLCISPVAIVMNGWPVTDMGERSEDWVSSEGPGKASPGSCSEYYVPCPVSKCHYLPLSQLSLNTGLESYGEQSSDWQARHCQEFNLNFHGKLRSIAWKQNSNHHPQIFNWFYIISFLTMQLCDYSSLEPTTSQDQDDYNAPYKVVNQARETVIQILFLAVFWFESTDKYYLIQIGKGKCLYSTRCIEEGEIVLIDSPIIQSPYTKSRKEWCCVTPITLLLYQSELDLQLRGTSLERDNSKTFFLLLY